MSYIITIEITYEGEQPDNEDDFIESPELGDQDELVALVEHMLNSQNIDVDGADTRYNAVHWTVS